MRIIASEADIAEGLACLTALDPVLRRAIAVAGPVPLRRSEAGFRGLARIVMGQQVSVAAAAAIAQRLEARVDPFTAEALLRRRDATLRSCGLSGPKIRAMRAIARAIVDDDLRLGSLAAMPVDEALRHLIQVKGIGAWTAEIYLMFCIGHADIFPSGDLALQAAWQHLAALEARPDAKALAASATRWQPWRGVAARLLWAYYRALKNGGGGPPL